MVEKEEWLKSRQDIKEVFTSGKRVYYKGLKLLYKKNEKSYNRIAITTKRGFKNAVIRNRQKRIVKEIWCKIKTQVRAGYDIVLNIFPEQLSYGEWEDRVRHVFKLAGLAVEQTRE